MSRTSRRMRGRGWSTRRPRSGRQARAASRTRWASPARSGLPGKLVEKRAMLVCFVVAKKARNEIQQRQSEPPAWSDDLGRLKIDVAGRVRGVDDRNRASADQEDDGGSGQLAIDASEKLEECRGFKLRRHAARRGPGRNPPPCS